MLASAAPLARARSVRANYFIRRNPTHRRVRQITRGELYV